MGGSMGRGIKGRVTLVGAGPGDAELLTLKAVRALQAADVILFDDLVSADVLDFASASTRRISVGKRAGRDSCRQENINAMMIALALQGKNVVRLKSGDPMIFGRAGEEIHELEQRGIAVDVVPGITSGLALASRLGVSLTHRDHAQSVRFITGHARSGTLPSHLDWQSLADPATTTVYYMSRRTLHEIVDHLDLTGMAGDVPCVMASSLFTPQEQHWAGSLNEAIAASARFSLDAPFIFATGRALGHARSCSYQSQPVMQASG
jgi:uroporphyrin-III C-methyltransferase/precorrin-2 dehydrogenase/sirohydrochlorin ferrochelatase